MKEKIWREIDEIEDIESAGLSGFRKLINDLDSRFPGAPDSDFDFELRDNGYMIIYHYEEETDQEREDRLRLENYLKESNKKSKLCTLKDLIDEFPDEARSMLSKKE